MSAAARRVVSVEVQGDGTFCGVSVVHIGEQTVLCRVTHHAPDEPSTGPRYECSACGRPERSCVHLKLAMGARRLLLGDEAS